MITPLTEFDSPKRVILLQNLLELSLPYSWAGSSNGPWRFVTLGIQEEPGLLMEPWKGTGSWPPRHECTTTQETITFGESNEWLINATARNENPFSYYSTGPIFCFWGFMRFYQQNPPTHTLYAKGSVPSYHPWLNGQFWALKIAGISQSAACLFAGGLPSNADQPWTSTARHSEPATRHGTSAGERRSPLSHSRRRRKSECSGCEGKPSSH